MNRCGRAQLLLEAHHAQGTNIDTGEDVTNKLEHVSIDPSLLKDEVDNYRLLAGGAGISRIYAFKTDCEYKAMVFDLLGPSLEDLFNFCGRKFSLKTVATLIDQLICRLQHLHPKRVMHRDIKPENFLKDVRKRGNHVYVTDFGLAAERRAAQVPIDHAQNPQLIGTARFASINGHLGVGKCDILGPCCAKMNSYSKCNIAAMIWNPSDICFSVSSEAHFRGKVSRLRMRRKRSN